MPRVSRSYDRSDGASTESNRTTGDESAAWSAAVTGDDSESYNAYLAAFPNGAHVHAANLRIAQIAAGKDPASPEEQAWAAALKGDTALSYGQYLKEPKYLTYVKSAKDRIRQIIAASAPMQKRQAATFVPDQSLLLEPYCVKCSAKANIGNSVAIGPARGIGYCPRSKDIYINPLLVENRWLKIVSAGTAVPDGTFIGSSDGFDAYVANPAYWQRFVLAIQQAQESGNGVASGGKKVAGAGGSTKKIATTLQLPAQAAPLIQEPGNFRQ